MGIAMKSLPGSTLQEIADATALTPSGVKQVIDRSVRKLWQRTGPRSYFGPLITAVAQDADEARERRQVERRRMIAEAVR